MLTLRELDLFDKYIMGKLTRTERAMLDFKIKDKKFLKEFGEIKQIVAGIQYAAITEKCIEANRQIKFLEKGGVFLRSNKNSKGEAVIEALSLDNDWGIALICEDYLSCNRLIKKMVKKYPLKFQVLNS